MRSRFGCDRQNIDQIGRGSPDAGQIVDIDPLPPMCLPNQVCDVDDPVGWDMNRVSFEHSCDKVRELSLLVW